MVSEQPIILLIDDTTEVRWACQSVLEEAGYRILGAGDSDEALSLIEAHRSEIRLIIQDCYRPLGRCLGGDNEIPYPDSGVRFYQRVLSVRFPEIPVVFVSGRAAYVYGHEVDVPVYEKPLGQDVLISLAERALFPSDSHSEDQEKA